MNRHSKEAHNHVVIHCLSYWNMLFDDEPGTTYYCCIDLRGCWVNLSFAGANSQGVVIGAERDRSAYMGRTAFLR